MPLLLGAGAGAGVGAGVGGGACAGAGAGAGAGVVALLLFSLINSNPTAAVFNLIMSRSITLSLVFSLL